MDKKSDILTKVGKDAGFNVPEGYFADFAKKMAASLPEKQIPAKRKTTRWLRIRPYVYMAAMFAGVWCMGYLFKDLKTRSGEIAAEGQIAEAMKDKDMWNELEKSGTVSIDDLLNDTIGIDTSMDFDTTAN